MRGSLPPKAGGHGFLEIRGSWYLQAHVADRIAPVAVAGGTADRTMVLIGMFSFLEDLSRKSNKSAVNHTARALRFRGALASSSCHLCAS